MRQAAPLIPNVKRQTFGEINMTTEFCPLCNTIRNMRITVSRSKEIRNDGKNKEIEIRIYHCESCNLFVRSDDIDISEENTRLNGAA